MLPVLGIVGATVPVSSVASATGLPAANAQLITVTGGAVSDITATSTSFTAPMSPAFSPRTTDYVLDCPTGTSSVTFTMTAASGTITVNGQTGATEAATVSLTTDQAAVVQVRKQQYWIRCLPPDFPPLKTVTDNGKSPDGLYLTQTALSAPGIGSYVMALDNHGTPVWWQKTVPGGAGYFDMWQPDVFAWDSASNGGSPNFNNAAGYTTYNLRTGETATVVPTNAPADGHAIVHLADGNILFLTDPEVTGVDLTSIGKGTDQNIADCAMQEVTPYGHVVWSWDSLQHIGIDESIDPISDTVAGQQVWDVFHCNSVSLEGGGADNPETANIVLSSRENSSVYLINRKTGNVIWKVGGVKPAATDPDATAKFITVQGDPEGGFYAQHNAQVSADGKQLTLFDDHSGAPLYSDPSETPGPARGVEYTIDESAGTASLIWSTVAPDNLMTLATGSFNRYQVTSGGYDSVVGWGLNNTVTSGGVTTSKLFSDVSQNGTTDLAVDWLQPAGATFPSITASYRVIKVNPTQLDINLLRQNMGGL
jgi:hypothetical protein